VGGLSVLFRSAWYGTTVVLHDGFDAERVRDALFDDGVTLVSLVPTALRRLLAVWGDRPAPPHLRAILVGGAAVPDRLVAEAAALGLPTAATYGMTEATSQIATQWPSRQPRRGAPPLAFAQVAVRGPSGITTQPGAEGEIVVRGPTVMHGYWDDPATTAKALRDGWLNTRDIGRLAPDGRLEVLGRADDVIISGGENVSPAEVEGVLAEHPMVEEACVVGLNDAEWGQLVAAAVVPVTRVAPGALTPEALDAWLRPRLAGHKRPRRIAFVGELPRNPAGKVLRSAVRDLVAQA
jgi:O-succinylbenzoic acid--CoA ligase